MNNYLCIYVFTLYLYIYCCQALLSCKNEDNKNVDWFILLKIPASYNFFYLSSDSNTGKWMTPNYALNDNRNFLALTLAQMYDSQKNEAFFVLYNDLKPKQLTEKKKSKGGHLKGVVNFDKNTGYWLVHSVPKFPYKDKYNYTDGHAINGQSFLCVSLAIKDLKSIVTQLLIMYSDVYKYNVPNNFTSDPELMTELYNLVGNMHTPGKKSERIDFSTISDVKLSHFGKSENYFNDLYDGLMSPGLNTSLFVETWMKGPGDKIPSYCLSSNKVYNVEKVSINGVEYSETIDHSKWAVSGSKFEPVVCIGDINRMVTQESRGGGSLCIFSLTIWNAFFPIVKDYEHCPKYDFIL